MHQNQYIQIEHHSMRNKIKSEKGPLLGTVLFCTFKRGECANGTMQMGPGTFFSILVNCDKLGTDLVDWKQLIVQECLKKVLKMYPVQNAQNCTKKFPSEQKKKRSPIYKFILKNLIIYGNIKIYWF